MITKISLLLVLISGLIHPLWNMFLKKSEDKVVFYFNIHLAYTLMFSFILFLYPLKNINFSGWVFIILSAFAHFFYQIFLCRTYELGDMSLTYPVIRCSPVFVVFMGLIFLKEIPSKEALIGIGIIILGIQIINKKSLSFSEFTAPFKHINKKVIIAAVLTAFFSACYSIVDKKGVLTVEPILFFYLFFALSGFLFLIYLLFLKESRKRYFEILTKDKLKIVLAAILEFSSYVLILYAFRISKVAYIIALRQVSVIFGTLYGILFLKEQYGMIKFIGSIIVFIGIFLVTISG